MARAKTSAPRWTRGRLVLVLAMVFGTNRRGGPDTKAVAEAVGVSQRSVQRWIRGQNRWRAKIPPARLAQICQLALPDEQTLRDEQRTADYARDALARVALPNDRGVLESWRKQRWLEEHVVVVIELPAVQMRQVAFTRATSRVRTRGELTKRGQLVQETSVATRFHAILLVHDLLGGVRPWRIHARAVQPRRGPTQTWLADAPDVDIEALAVTTGPK